MTPRQRVRRPAFLCSLLIFALSVAAFAAEPDPNGICPVHGVAMKAVRLKLVYGMPSPQEFEEMQAAKKNFPFGRDYVLAGCVIKPEKTIEGFLCTKCVEARDEWLRSRAAGGKK